MAEHVQKLSLFDPKIVRRAAWDSVTKLDPRTLMRNPVMFVVEVVAAVTTILFVRDLLGGTGHPGVRWPYLSMAVVHRTLRQFRRGHGRRTRQGSGGHPATHQDGGHGEATALGRAPGL